MFVYASITKKLVFVRTCVFVFVKVLVYMCMHVWMCLFLWKDLCVYMHVCVCVFFVEGFVCIYVCVFVNVYTLTVWLSLCPQSMNTEMPFNVSTDAGRGLGVQDNRLICHRISPVLPLRTMT